MVVDQQLLLSGPIKPKRDEVLKDSLKQRFVDWLFRDTKIRRLQTGTKTITLSDVIKFPDHAPAHTPAAVGEIGFKAEQDTAGEDRVVYYDRTGSTTRDLANTDEIITTSERSKLSGIETGATADQSNAEIKSAYEANADTNEFSDTEQSKLAGIAAGATADLAHTLQRAYEGSGDVSLVNNAILMDTHASFVDSDSVVYKFANSIGVQVAKVVEVQGRHSDPYMALNGVLSGTGYVGLNYQWGGTDKLKLRWHKPTDKFYITTTTGDAFIMTAAGAITTLSTINGRNIATDGATLDALGSPAGAIWSVETELVSNGSFNIDISSEANCAYLLILYEMRASSAATASHNLFMGFNGAVTNYDNQLSILRRNQTTVGQTSQDDGHPNTWGLAGRIPGGTVSNNLYGVGQCIVYNPFSTGRWKQWVFHSWESENTGASTQQMFAGGGGSWESTAAITDIQFGANAFGDCETGSKVTIYGMAGSVS